jgi:penicillin amidase
VWAITGTDEDRLYDVFEAMGYNVATDRLWQGETFRRSARGRLAEIFGAAYVSQDSQVRTTGYSDQELADGFAALGQEERDVINGYVAGFNRRIAEIRKDPTLLPFEFSAIGITSVTLEDWSYKDVLAWAVLMMRNFDPEALNHGQIDNAALYTDLVTRYGMSTGVKMFEDLRWLDDPAALTYIPNPVKTPLSVTPAAATPLMANPPASVPDLRAVAERLNTTQEQIDESLKKINAYVKMGSYAWAIKGTKTATGNPMIYSGPQMGFTVPSIIGEGSIKAGGLNVSGMIITGLPAIIIGRTPHHAWSMQVGHAHSLDYYMESPTAVTLNRTETIKVAGAADVSLPIYRTAHGPVINAAPPISWKYAHWGYEFKVIKAYLALARATSMDQFGAGIEDVPLSQHFTYADRDGNIAYWMSGRDPIRPYGGEWRMPQGALGTALEWDAAKLIPRTTDRNTSQGYYCGWNNKARAGYANNWNNTGYSFGVAHRAHVVDDYLSVTNGLTYDQVKDLALNIATTDSFGYGGNPWKIASSHFINAVNTAPDAPVAARTTALALLAAWDGHFVDGGSVNWTTGMNRADAWVLMDAWIKAVIDLTFEELNADATLQKAKSYPVLFNALLHGLATGGLTNYYNWFQNADPTAPQTANAIIVKALDNTLTTLGAPPWGTDDNTITKHQTRKTIDFKHDMLGLVYQIPFSSRSTYAHVLEFGAAGPVNLKSMFPLGESGDIRVGGGGAPVFDANFFTMAPVYDNFVYRDFPLP